MMEVWFVLYGRQKGLQFFRQLALGTDSHLYHKVSGRWYNVNIVDITRPVLIRVYTMYYLCI